ncbi:flagellar filament capping protein FliD [Iocasia frigidifontis]|uniref:Flagellar hook-associated protein 2 n=1 Tax=Iocasia fonsfrigidae TaxID=2682810 RepID=A0A8A7KFJ8_9FIRM|nr:flagellar filament capping protein FliD [Iocasia fonsfrigidae]QTL96934.1 flagellar filament capping protein FliD [Iocasia fonsfrigidae]
MGLSIGGFNGIDTDELLTKLMYIEKAPLRRLEEDKKEVQAQISAWQQLNSALDTFKSKAGDLSDIFDKMAPTVDDEEVLTATANSFASSGNYEIEVKQLFQAHTVASSAEVEADTISGSFDIEINDYSITIDVSEASLQDIADKINNTIIDHDGDSNTDKIQLAQASVVDNKLVVQAAGDVINEGTNITNEVSFTNETNNILSTLHLDTMDTVQNHQMAQFKVNGLLVERGSNEDIDDVIKGVTLNLEGKLSEAGETTTLRVGTDKEAMKEKIKAFVDQYNSLLKTINKYGHPDEAEIEKGEGDAVLSGESALSTVESMMYSSVMNPNGSLSSADWLSNTPLSWDAGTTNNLVIDGTTVSLDGASTLEEIAEQINTELGKDMASIKDNRLVLTSEGSLAVDLTGSDGVVLTDLQIPETFKTNVVSLMGITVDRYGEMSIDEDKLDQALSKNMSDVKQMFTGVNGIVDRVETNVDNAIKSYSYSSGGGYVSGRISTLQKEIKYIDEDIENMERRLDMKEITLKAKFTRMDQLMTQLKNQGSWFTSNSSS